MCLSFYLLLNYLWCFKVFQRYVSSCFLGISFLPEGCVRESKTLGVADDGCSVWLPVNSSKDDGGAPQSPSPVSRGGEANPLVSHHRGGKRMLYTEAFPTLCVMFPTLTLSDNRVNLHNNFPFLFCYWLSPFPLVIDALLFQISKLIVKNK